MTRRRDLLRTGALALAGLAGCTTGETPDGRDASGDSPTATPTYDAPAWFTDRGDLAHTASVNGSISVPLTERWRTSLGGAAGTPVGGHGQILVGADDGTLYALDPGDGSTAWSFDVGTPLTAAPTAVELSGVGTPETTTATRLPKGEEKHVFVTGQDGALYSVDPTGPSQRWATSTGSGNFHSPPVYADGHAFYAYGTASRVSALRAVDPASGTVQWTSSNHNKTGATPMHGLGNVHLGLGTQSGTVLVSFDARTGTEQWRYRETGSGAGSTTSGVLDTDVPVGDPARVYFSPRESTVAGVEAAGGTGVWETSLSNFGIVYGFALTQDRSTKTLVVSQKRSLYGLDPASGNVRWTYSHGGTARNGRTGRIAKPAIYGDHVYHVVDGDKLVAVSLSGGTEEWSTTLDATSYASPAVGGGTVYVTTSNGTVYAFSP